MNMNKQELKILVKECLTEAFPGGERYIKDTYIMALTKSGSSFNAYKILWGWIKQNKIRDVKSFMVLAKSIPNFKFDTNIDSIIDYNTKIVMDNMELIGLKDIS